jgi:hypothetical protein
MVPPLQYWNPDVSFETVVLHRVKTPKMSLLLSIRLQIYQPFQRTESLWNFMWIQN